MIMKMMLVCCLNWRCWRPRSLLVIHTRWRHVSWYGVVRYGIILIPLSRGGVVWYGVVSYSLAPPPSPRTHMARGHSWRIWCDEIRIGNAWIKLTLNADDDIQEVIYGYERRNPHKHTTLWSLRRLVYWRCEEPEAMFVKCDSPYKDTDRVRKTLSVRQQCWPESFCESWKFLQPAHYWLESVQTI